jgi:hypothetical protein
MKTAKRIVSAVVMARGMMAQGQWQRYQQSGPCADLSRGGDFFGHTTGNNAGNTFLSVTPSTLVPAPDLCRHVSRPATQQANGLDIWT